MVRFDANCKSRLRRKVGVAAVQVPIYPHLMHNAERNNRLKELPFGPEYLSLHDVPVSMPVVDADWWARALSIDDFIAQASSNVEFWKSTRRLAAISDAARLRAAAIDVPRRLLVILEDWCGDAVNTVPVIQRLAESNTMLALRVLRRDENLPLMDAHLSGTSRAIPVAMVLDTEGRHFGWWGSRPSPLQRWRLLEGNAMEQNERYKIARTWYARDRGRTTVDEILMLLERSVIS